VDESVLLEYKVQNLNPQKSRISEEAQKEFDECGDLTKKYFWQPINKRFVKYVVVIGEDPNRTFTYRCLLCEKVGCDKTFEQSVSNESMSNYKRHLRKIHKIQSEKFKKGKRGIPTVEMKTENGVESDENGDDEDEEDNLVLSILSKSANVENGNKQNENENEFIGGS